MSKVFKASQYDDIDDADTGIRFPAEVWTSVEFQGEYSRDSIFAQTPLEKGWSRGGCVPATVTGDRICSHLTLPGMEAARMAHKRRRNRTFKVNPRSRCLFLWLILVYSNHNAMTRML